MNAVSSEGWAQVWGGLGLNSVGFGPNSGRLRHRQRKRVRANQLWSRISRFRRGCYQSWGKFDPALLASCGYKAGLTKLEASGKLRNKRNVSVPTPDTTELRPTQPMQGQGMDRSRGGCKTEPPILRRLSLQHNSAQQHRATMAYNAKR